MKWFVNKLVAVQTIFFIFVISYSIATLANPEQSSARFISLITGGYTYPLCLVTISGLFAAAGLFRASTPLKLWVFLFPFLLYIGTAVVSIIVSPSPSPTAVMTLLFIIAIGITFVWEKING